MPSSDGVFLTGFPGFIATRLLRRLLPEHPESTFYLLVQPSLVFAAESACRKLEGEHPGFTGRWRLVVGDIREHDLGIDRSSLDELRARVTHAWHLAALYDLSVAQSLAYAVNVTGTARVLQWCAGLENLQRLLYISTCFVAGQREGRIYENELDCGQDFKNHYESTKFWAELQVQERWRDLPTTIFRPAIVAGDSVTGEVAKADGPYFMIQLLLALPKWLPMVHFGRSQAPFNVVPVDFVVEAMVRLSKMDASLQRVFQLADPMACSAGQVFDLTISALGRPSAIATIPASFAERFLAMPQIRRWLAIPAESMTYLDHPSSFDVSNTAELLADQIQCPRFGDYWPRLVDYARNHPEIFRRAS